MIKKMENFLKKLNRYHFGIVQMILYCHITIKTTDIESHNSFYHNLELHYTSFFIFTFYGVKSYIAHHKIITSN